MSNLDHVLSAIAHPSRRAIIARLSTGPARVTDIAEPFQLSLNAVSKHLKVLEGAGLIQRHRVGRDHVIEFTGTPLRAVSHWLHEYERFWGERMDHLVDYFEQKRKKK